MSDWFSASLSDLLAVFLSALAIYAVVALLTRLVGLRSFSKMSSFDFAITVAIGSVVASTMLLEDVPLPEAVVAIGTLYVLQLVVGWGRGRWRFVSRAVDNQPMLLMAGTEVLHDHLRRAQVTEADLRSKLRQANVRHLDHVRAVVLETTGSVAVVHADPAAPPLDAALFEDVIGAERLREAGLVV